MTKKLYIDICSYIDYKILAVYEMKFDYLQISFSMCVGFFFKMVCNVCGNPDGPCMAKTRDCSFFISELLVNSEDWLVHFSIIFITAPTYYLYFYSVFFNINLLSFFFDFACFPFL